MHLELEIICGKKDTLRQEYSQIFLSLPTEEEVLTGKVTARSRLMAKKARLGYNSGKIKQKRS
jgi:hypothetical protein